MTMSNPYTNIYTNHHFRIDNATSMKDAQQLSINISMLYNTLGLAIKDLIKLLSYVYPNNKQQQVGSIHQEYQQSLSIEQRNTGKIPSVRTVPAIIQEQKLPQKQRIHSKIFNFDRYKLDKQQEQGSNFNKVNQAIKQNNRKKQNNSYERVEITRNRNQRENLNGYSCMMCEKFYELLGQEFSDKSGKQKLCDGCSRHRSNYPATKYFNDFSQQFGFDD